MTVGDIKYDPGCFDCRKDAGKPEAGLHEDNVCYPHLLLRFVAYEQKMTARVKVLVEACKAYKDLLACYRIGKRPSEKLFSALEKADAALAGEEEKR